MLAPTSKELYQITDIMDFEQPIFVHCDDSNRSASTCTLLIKKGFLKVYNLKEGLIGWKLYGFIINKKDLKKSGNSLFSFLQFIML